MGMWERRRERLIWFDPQYRPDLRPWLGRISRFRPPHRARLVPIWSLETGRHTPTILVTGKRLERRCLKLENSRPKTHHHRHRFRWILGTPPAGFYSSRHQHHFLTNVVTWNGRIVDDRPLRKLAVLGARSTAFTARGRSPQALLDSPMSELSDLSFPSSLTEVRSPLTGRGNSVISQNFRVNL